MSKNVPTHLCSEIFRAKRCPHREPRAHAPPTAARRGAGAFFLPLGLILSCDRTLLATGNVLFLVGITRRGPPETPAPPFRREKSVVTVPFDLIVGTRDVGQQAWERQDARSAPCTFLPAWRAATSRRVDDYGPYLPGVGCARPATGRAIPYDDVDALAAALDAHADRVAAFLAEPIMLPAFRLGHVLDECLERLG